MRCLLKRKTNASGLSGLSESAPAADTFSAICGMILFALYTKIVSPMRSCSFLIMETLCTLARETVVPSSSMLQIKDIMMKSEELKASAKNNTEKDFEFAYFDNIDDALIEGLNQNQDFFSLLLGNDEIKKEVLGIFAEEIYRGLRAGK